VICRRHLSRDLFLALELGKEMKELRKSGVETKNLDWLFGFLIRIQALYDHQM
jgi:hypothetical protein